MRERLIELIINADTYDSYECKLCNKDDDACDCCYAEKLADKLLANGVIVPPCKVGGGLWWIDEYNHIQFQENDVRGIFMLKDGKCKVMDADGCVDELGTRYAYLTKEDAERALKGGDE